jgi:hypothetical protein
MPKKQILVRIDDKLNRIKQGNDILDKDEDVIQEPNRIFNTT